MRKGKKKLSRSKNAAPNNWLWWTGCLALVAAIAGIGLFYGQKVTGDQQLDPTPLTGHWQRPDGGYVLQLAGIGPGGAVNASYFNPRPINVSRSQWQKKEGRLELFVELRDVHYPGSTYTLYYRREKDRLEGIYYQAALRQRFAVEFVRIK
jgi:hypothetical protein